MSDKPKLFTVEVKVKTFVSAFSAEKAKESFLKDSRLSQLNVEVVAINAVETVPNDITPTSVKCVSIYEPEANKWSNSKDNRPFVCWGEPKEILDGLTNYTGN